MGGRWVGGKAILRTADRSQKWQGVWDRDTHIHTHIRIKKTNRKKRYGQMSKFKWKFDKHQSLKLKLAEILVVGVKNQKDVKIYLD